MGHVNINTNFCIAQTSTVRPRAHYTDIISCVIRSSMYDWKETFPVLDEKQMLILFFSRRKPFDFGGNLGHFMLGLRLGEG